MVLLVASVWMEVTAANGIPPSVRTPKGASAEIAADWIRTHVASSTDGTSKAAPEVNRLGPWMMFTTSHLCHRSRCQTTFHEIAVAFPKIVNPISRGNLLETVKPRLYVRRGFTVRDTARVKDSKRRQTNTGQNLFELISQTNYI
jgi:hypothetical protein